MASPTKIAVNCKALLANTTRASNSIAGLTETLDYTLRAGGFKENSQLALQSLRRAAENVEVATTGIRKLSDDPTTTTDLKRTLVALRESTESLRDTASFASKVSWRAMEPANSKAF